MTRTPFVGGNWKMHTDRAGGVALALAVAAGAPDGCETSLFPPFPYLLPVAEALAGTALTLGAQDCHHEPEGAFTGEVSIPMLAECGVGAVLTGHSERRHVLGETDETVARKTHAVLKAGLACVLCIGERLEERREGRTDEVNARQLRAALEGLDAGAFERLVVAYEPVWAIGTGNVATPEDAQDAHAHIRGVLGEIAGAERARTTRIIYGGSLKPDNARDLLARPDIDGGLVGGASLDPAQFLEILRAAAENA